MKPIRRLDHVAIAVKDTGRALAYFVDQLGLAAVHSEELLSPRVRLTYLDLGNCYLQLVQPLEEANELSDWITSHGEGLHHVCFGVDDVEEAVMALSGSPATLGSGRGRVSAFVPKTSLEVILECTTFVASEDTWPYRIGWLDPDQR